MEHITFPKPARRTAAQRHLDRQERRAQRHADPHGKPAEDRKAKAAEERFRRAVCLLVMKRSQFCEVCGDSEAETAQKSPIQRHEVHEVIPRSHTMGMEASKRFSAAICARVCRPCHEGLGMRVGGRLFRIVFHDDALGMTGDYDIRAVRDGHIIRHMRRGIDSRVCASPSIQQESL